MIDIETFGQSPNAAIASIGAVKFDLSGTHEEWYGVPEDIEGDFDGRTVLWWLEQSVEARSALTCPTYGKQSLTWLLGALGRWTYRAERIWAKPPTFDLVILHSARQRLRARGILVGPWWPRRNERCLRTLLDLAGPLDLPDHAEVGVHNALEDARHQARLCIAALNKLGAAR